MVRAKQGGRSRQARSRRLSGHTRLVVATLAAALACSAPAHATSDLPWRDISAKEAKRDRAALVAEVRRRPQDAAAHLRYGRRLAADYHQRHDADWRPAAAAFEFALQLDPALPTARLELGRLYAAAGRPRLAAQVLAEYVAVTPGDASALADYALASLRAGDLTSAVWAGRAAAKLSGERSVLIAAALATGVAATDDAPIPMQRLQAIDPTQAEATSRDIAVWRQAAALAPAVLAQAAALPPAAVGATNAAGPSAAADWRSCEPAGQASSYPSGAYGGLGSSQTIGPQPLPALPAPCATAPSPRMVLLEAVIVRQRDETAETRGVNLLSTLQLVARGRIRVYDEEKALEPTVSSNFLTLSLPDNGITYLLNILNDQANRTDVLAKPSLVALDRTASVFFSGATITVPVSGQYTGTLQEKAVGVSLAVTPTILPGGEMLLAVNAGRSFLEEDIQADLDQGIQTTSNIVTANVRIRYDETLVISGLVEKEDESAGNAVPVLGRLPLGDLFLAERAKRRLRNNVIILLTPREPNATGPRPDGDDSLARARYDRRLADAVAARARSETPEADRLQDLARGFAAADLLDRLPITLDQAREERGS